MELKSFRTEHAFKSQSKKETFQKIHKSFGLRLIRIGLIRDFLTEIVHLAGAVCLCIIVICKIFCVIKFVCIAFLLFSVCLGYMKCSY